jgi:hypothetical protein
MGKSTFFIVEASHLFRAGDKHQCQFFVMDVVNFLHTLYPDTDAKVIVLHGSVKNEQADRYAAALERFGAKVIRMKPIASVVGPDKVYYKPTWYLHGMMGQEIPKGSDVVLIGFHNPRYRTFLQKYSADFSLSMAAFTTPSRKQGWMSIPEDFKPFLKRIIGLDEHVADIQAQFKQKRSTKGKRAANPA